MFNFSVEKLRWFQLAGCVRASLRRAGSIETSPAIRARVLRCRSGRGRALLDRSAKRAGKRSTEEVGHVLESRDLQFLLSFPLGNDRCFNRHTIVR